MWWLSLIQVGMAVIQVYCLFLQIRYTRRAYKTMDAADSLLVFAAGDRGSWEKYDDSDFCYCSKCGNPAAKDEDVSWHSYCPVCGSPMTVVVSESEVSSDG